MSVRELRKTETTDIIMLYSGTMQTVLACVACVTVPGSLAAPQHTWQAATLLLLGDNPAPTTTHRNTSHMHKLVLLARECSTQWVSAPLLHFALVVLVLFAILRVPEP